MNRINFSATVLFILFFILQAYAQIYVSPTGDDNNPGTIEQPLKSITAAVSSAQAGDTVFVRGGVYSLTTTISISKSGSEGNRYYLLSYQDERPVLDFSSMLVGSSNRGIRLSGSYWYIKGIDIKGAGDNGMNMSGSNNIIEFCSFYENRDTGLQIGGGASNNQIINCDSYFNADPDHNDADGFAPKLDVGTNNYFYGCRAWQNSDDGWDGYLRGADDVSTILDNCWIFNNGYLKNGTDSDGNGNGFKMGGSDDKMLMHNVTLRNCLAFDNRERGFDQNNNRGSMTLYNCTAYRNGSNYYVSLAGNKAATIVNCIALGYQGPLGTFVIQQTNSWQSPFSATAGDFVSIDTMGVRGPRKSDGSLPDLEFMQLVEGSDLINAGTDVGLPFNGIAPDLGAFELGETVPVELVAFSASVTGKDIILNWATASELNNYGFEVQKKFDGSDFITIGFVPGSGTTTETNQYQFIHKNSEQGINIYRLKQIDFSGTFSFSDEVQINFNAPDEFILFQNYPNPFNPGTAITFSLAEKAPVSLQIYNLVGELIVSLITNELKEPGTYSINFNASGLSSGTYIYVLKQGENILSKKMILLK